MQKGNGPEFAMLAILDMNPSPWVGAVTGIVGCLTGMAGAVMGYISYRRVSALKALDLRLELRRSEVDAQQASQELVALIAKANASRVAVAAAKGMLNDSAMDAWKQQVKQDREQASRLRDNFPSPLPAYTGLSHARLEARLIEVHALSRTIQGLMNWYRSELAADDRDREHIQRDMRSRFD